MRIVIDTNVFISATIKKGTPPRTALNFAMRNGVLLFSGDVIQEFSEKIVHKKFVFVGFRF